MQPGATSWQQKIKTKYSQIISHFQGTYETNQTAMTELPYIYLSGEETVVYCIMTFIVMK